MKNQKKYDKEFKLNAIKLYKEGGKTCGEIAANLGIPKSTLYTWAMEYEDNGEERSAVTPHATISGGGGCASVLSYPAGVCVVSSSTP